MSAQECGRRRPPRRPAGGLSGGLSSVRKKESEKVGSSVKRGPVRRWLLACPCPVGPSTPPSPPGTPPTTRSVARVTHPVPRPAASSLASLFRPTSPPHHWRVGPRVLGDRAPSPRPQCAFASGAGHNCPGLAAAQRGASGASRRLHGMEVHGSSTGEGPGPVCLAGRRSSTALDPVPGRQTPLPALRTLGLPHLLPRSPSSARLLAL